MAEISGNIIDKHDRPGRELNFISRRMRQIRQYRHMTQSQMATLMGTTQQAYSGMENHVGAIGLATLMSFCNASVVNIHLLLSEDIAITERTVNHFNDRKLSWIIEDNQRLRAAVDFCDAMVPLRKTG